jgi:hypothetical protein
MGLINTFYKRDVCWRNKPAGFEGAAYSSPGHTHSLWFLEVNGQGLITLIDSV